MAIIILLLLFIILTGTPGYGQTPGITIVTTSTTVPNSFSHVLEVLTYDLVVTNTGDVILENIAIDDVSAVVTGSPVTILAPGQTMNINAIHLVTQADIDAGGYTNTATASAISTDINHNKITVSSTSSTVTPAIRDFSLSVALSANPQKYVPVNENISYTIVLINTGNTTLSDVYVTDVVPSFTTYVSSGNSGVYSGYNRTVTWEVHSLSPGQTVTLQLVVSVDGNTEHLVSLNNIASATNIRTGAVLSNAESVQVLRSPLLWLVSSTDIECYGAATGSATVQFAAGSPPVSYTWNTVPEQVSPAATDLSAGMYTVSVVDALGHGDQMTITIHQPSAPVSTRFVTGDVTCHGQSTGTITQEVIGGTPPYTFLWNNNASSKDLENLPAGPYSVQITDARGCAMTDVTAIHEPVEPIEIFNIAVTDVECLTDPYGSVRFDISGGVPPYTYLWSNSATTMYLDNVTGGDYELTIRDNIGCAIVRDFLVQATNDDCKLRIPGGLTPGQQYDNKLIIKGLDRYPNNSFHVYNRYGTLVYEAAPYLNDWDGVPNKGSSSAEFDGLLPDGTYYYLLEPAPDMKPLSGYIYLIRK